MAEYRLRAEAGHFTLKGGDVKMKVMGPVRDARLAELEFLTMLERHRVGWTFDPKSSNAADSHFGLGASALSEMVLELLIGGCLNDSIAALSPERLDRHEFLTAFEACRPAPSLLEDIRHMTDGIHIKLRINHRGRLRLWRLRDELRADRGREPFGILYDRRAWERELAVQVNFRTPCTRRRDGEAPASGACSSA